jgi:signal transduction histidine kinase
MPSSASPTTVPASRPTSFPTLFELTGRPARGSHTGGAGLGLTIAARLLRSQGGTIEAANAPPRGAVLTIRLPPGPPSN